MLLFFYILVLVALSAPLQAVDGGTSPTLINVNGINQRLDVNENNVNNLSSTTTLSINTLNSTTTSILGYIDRYTAVSSLQINNLNVSGFTKLNNDVTLLSSSNVSGSSILIKVQHYYHH